MLSTLPRFFSCAVLTVSIATTVASHAQDAYATQTKTGIALVKPQAWSKPAEATVMEFQALANRTGYYEFVTKAGEKRQVAGAKVVKIFVYPDISQFTEIVRAEDVQRLQTLGDEIKAVSTEFPAATSYMQPYQKQVQAELDKYNEGNVKLNGQWVSKTTYLADKATVLVSQLKADIVRSTSEIDLNNDPRFLSLKDLAKSNAKLNTAVAEIVELQHKQSRFQQRAEILAKLGNTQLTLAEADPMVARLRTLKPEEDPKSAAFIKAWDANLIAADKIVAQATPAIQEMEKEMGETAVENAPPKLSAGLAAKLSDLNAAIGLFLAASPAPQIAEKIRPARAVVLFNTDLPKVDTDFAAKQFLMAKDKLDGLSRQAVFVGPATDKVVASLQRYAADQIETFSKVREEAKLLADSGKKPEALAKYEAAFEIIPDSGVGDQIAQLKQEVPAPKAAK